MKLAAFSDIHGDFESLKIVWERLVADGLSDTIVLNAGDTVAYGPDTMACIDFVRDPAHNILTVRGNYDKIVAQFPQKEPDYRRKWARSRPDKYDAVERASAEVTDEARSWLRDLPEGKLVEIDGVQIMVSHYAPTGGKEGLWEETPQSRLTAIAAQVERDISVAITGHTHSPFVRRAGGVLFINPGSVGRSFGQPTYAEFEIQDGRAVSARIITCDDSPR